jgi:hypothetical protein
MRTRPTTVSLACLAVVALSGCSSGSSHRPGSYVVSTSSPNSAELVWAGVGARAGEDNSKVLDVPATLQGTPVKVCWNMAGASNGVETASGPDDMAMASGENLLPNYATVTGTGCVTSFILQQYLEVIPTGDWSLRITATKAPATAPTRHAVPTTQAARPSLKPTRAAPTAPTGLPVAATPSAACTSALAALEAAGADAVEPGEPVVTKALTDCGNVAGWIGGLDAVPGALGYGSASELTDETLINDLQVVCAGSPHTATCNDARSRSLLG